MNRRTKEVIAGLVLVASLALMLLFVRLEADTENTAFGIAVLVMVVTFFVSMFALISFSRTGWSVQGSEGQWNLAILLNPSGLLFWNKSYKEQTGEMKREDQKRDKEYYGQRKN